jgi:predicted RNase H-like HicB family nuclease
MSHPVGLVWYGASPQAWVLDLPGCVAGGADRATLESMLPVAIAEHLAWLREHGEPCDESTRWEVAEELTAGQHRQDFVFGGDRAPVSDADLDRYLARAEFARADLLAALRGVPDAVLNWAPPDTAFATYDAWAPEPRSIRDLLRHVLQLEVFYRGSLRDGTAPGIVERVGEPGDERRLTVEALRDLAPADRARVFGPLHPGSDTPGEWTLRKVLRRMISHDRAHAAEIVQRRTWILLGPPVLR